MAIIRGGDAEYESGKPSIDEKKEKFEKIISELVAEGQDHIDFSGRYIGLEEVTILAGLEIVKSFKHLTLSDNQVDNEALKILVESPNLKDIESLDLGINFLTDVGIKDWALLDGVRLEKLRILSLNDNRLGDDSVSSFLISSHATPIEILNLDYTQVGNGVCKAFAETSKLINLKEFHAERGYIDDEGIKQFLEWEGLENLSTLKLSSNKLTDEGVEGLSKSSRLKSIRILDLGYNQITDRGCEALADSKIIESLETLTVSRNPFTEEGAKKLKELKISGKLKNLILYEGVDNTPNLVNYSKPELLRPDGG
jgi:Ran GTPase-activating protein (RanGAP) involved in mRNA processing and transport